VQDCFFSPWPAKEPSPLRWHALCSSFVNGDWSSQRSVVLLLRPLAKRLVLFDKDDSLIDARFLLEDENVAPGVSIEMPVHKVIVGNLIEEKARPSQIKISPSDSSAQVHPPSLDFSRGNKFESDIRRKFGYCCLPKPTGEQRRATRRAGRLPGLLVGPGPSGNGPQNSGTCPGDARACHLTYTWSGR
jgi:hypothetical protein